MSTCLLMSFFVIVTVVGSAVTAISSSVQCIDEDGKPVDWYIIYKFPYLATTHQPLFGGYRYSVISSRTLDGWHLSPHNITDTKNSIFAKTLAPFYDSGSSNRHLLYSVFYNDQPPESDDKQTVSNTYAHSKGLLVGDEHQGFWLIHSVPHFAPASSSSYEYVNSGGRYGQVAMCITLDSKNLAKVVSQNFLTSKPYVYHTNVPSDQNSEFGLAINKLIKKQWSTSKTFADTHLVSVGGQHFRSFYKSPSDHVDLYAGIVAPQFNSSLLVESWRKNPGHPLDSDCSYPKTKVENVHNIAIHGFINSPEQGHFTYLDDHSKWAISEVGDQKNLVCLGDINRMESQYKRGGGTTCITSPTVWKAFNTFVDSVDRC